MNALSIRAERSTLLWACAVVFWLPGIAHGQVASSARFVLEEMAPLVASGEMQSQSFVTSVAVGDPLPLAEAASRSFTLESGVMATRVSLAIDVMPGSARNPINMTKMGTIPVAILSSATFRAERDVSQTSLTFGRSGDEPSLSRCSSALKDVNNDGLPDLVCSFKASLTALRVGDSLAVLKGITNDAGTAFVGSNTVTVTK